jgi:HMG (high mobility group) box
LSLSSTASDCDDSTGAVGKALGKKWGALDEKGAEKKKYEAMAKKDKERYEKQKLEYQNVCLFALGTSLSC